MLIYLFLAEALAATGVIYLVTDHISYWFIPLFLFAFFFAINLLYVLYILFTPLLFSKKVPEHPSKYAEISIRLALGWFIRWMRVKIIVEGKEKFPACPTVMVCNHRSMFDPVYLMRGFLNKRMIFVSKQEVQKVPIIGPHMFKAGFVFIDRQNPIQALRGINRAVKMMKTDKVNFGIYPEGTRSRDGKLQEYKSGGFLAAKKADAPIAVFSIQGSERVVKGLPFHRPHVVIHLEEVIPVETVRAHTVEELAAMAEEITAKGLADHPF